jgi:hypothetical protein
MQRRRLKIEVEHVSGKAYHLFVVANGQRHHLDDYLEQNGLRQVASGTEAGQLWVEIEVEATQHR